MQQRYFPSGICDSSDAGPRDPRSISTQGGRTARYMRHEDLGRSVWEKNGKVRKAK